MNRDNIILTVKSMKDINYLSNSNIKYINIDIAQVDLEVITYFKENGKNYLYAEAIDSKNGYIYVSYDTFFSGEKIIDNIVSSVPKELNQIEIAKYIYISLGKFIGYDINTIPEKNDAFNFNNINTINNIWGALVNSKATNQSYCKLYVYLCSLFNIKCDIVTVNNKGHLCNKLTIDNNNLIVDLTSDVPFIEANFKTRFFASYNDDICLDNKIGYVSGCDYNDLLIENKLKHINCSSDEFVFKFLLDTQKIININKIKPIELGIIYDILFNRFCPGEGINISNLYINNIGLKNHFILITYKDNYYSYNYNKKTFIKISEKELIENIENDRIGIYLNENISIKNKYKEVV